MSLCLSKEAKLREIVAFGSRSLGCHKRYMACSLWYDSIASVTIASNIELIFYI